MLLSPEEKVTALKLLEMQRHAMLMYTSCGWFFDELSGLETVQVIHYAGRVVELAKEFFGQEVEPQFLDRLRLAKSNIAEYGDGAQIYEKWVKPAAVDIEKLAGHYAISSLFEDYSEKTRNLLLPGRSRTVFAGGRGQAAAGYRTRAFQLADHSRVRVVELWRLAPGRP